MNRITNSPIKLGVLGKSLPHTFSPEIHSSLLKLINIQGSYEVYEMNEQEVTGIIHFMKENHITGLNVTIPYKEVLYRMMDVNSIHASAIGAVNTVLFKDNITYGFNTDYLGVLSMFHKAGVSLKGKSIVLLGCGGAARALVYAFYLDGADSITIAARNEHSASLLQKQFPFTKICSMDDIPAGDVIINATPVGMFPDTEKSPVSENIIKQFHIAADIVYNPTITEFLKIAENAGLKTIAGLTMLIDQAVASEEIWLDRKINNEIAEQLHHKISSQFD